MWEGRRELGLRGRNEQVTKLTEAPGRGGGRGRKAWRLTGRIPSGTTSEECLGLREHARHSTLGRSTGVLLRREEVEVFGRSTLGGAAGSILGPLWGGAEEIFGRSKLGVALEERRALH